MRTVILGLLLVGIANPAFAIKKCKDADGKWHYGDVAVQECEHSKITTLNDRGFITDEVPPPKTEQELKIEAEEQTLLEAEQSQKDAELEEQRRVLSIYETENDIDRQRDNQLNSVQSNIDVHKAYLKGMDTRLLRFQEKKEAATTQPSKDNYQSQIDEATARIENAKLELAALEAQKGDIVEKFAREKKFYKELKNKK